jgi:phosphatidate cytidylyltransferase
LAHALSETPVDNRWSDLGLRVTSAIILGPIALFCVIFGGLAWQLLLIVAVAGLGWEWARLARPMARAPDAAPAIMIATLALTIAVARFSMPAGFAVMLAGTAWWVWRGRWFAAFGIPYAALAGLSLLWLRLQPHHGLLDTLFLVAVVWSTDIGAYVFGRMFGGARMAPAISPGKTWSGAMGGVAVACIAGGLLAARGQGFDAASVPAAMLLSVCAQAGDLFESAIKRHLGVKDSGRTIPGHGGLFDRLDGFLWAAPMAGVLAVIAEPGGWPLWG